MEDFNKRILASIQPQLKDISPPDMSWMHAQQKQIDARNNPVLQAFDSLVEYVKDFESSLDDEHEVAASLASFGSVITFHIRTIGYSKPDILTFEGVTSEGNRVKLIQHVAQLNVLLMATKLSTESPKKPIGFISN
jgi:hypothetical protein